jgi:hypothetical protein
LTKIEEQFKEGDMEYMLTRHQTVINFKAHTGIVIVFNMTAVAVWQSTCNYSKME